MRTVEFMDKIVNKRERILYITAVTVAGDCRIISYFPVRQRQGETQVQCSCRHDRASLYRDKSAASEQEVRRCRSHCTGSERDGRCASPRHQTEPLAADNRMLQRYDSSQDCTYQLSVG